MRAFVLVYHQGIAEAARIPALSRPGTALSVRELAVVVMLGACAAVLCGWLKLGLGIPGHNILRVMFPTALALALVPRRGTASLVGGAGCGFAGVLPPLLGPGSLGMGAATSLLLTGILIDAALLRSKAGWSIYVRLILAGLAANSIAFTVKAVEKLSGAGMGSSPFAVWWPKAIVTYLVCGALAGLISAAVWFRFAGRRDSSDSVGVK